MAQESSWWSYASNTASSAWNTVQSSAQDIANDFSTAFQEENEETIKQIKEKVDKETISNQLSKTTESIKNVINNTLQSISTESIKSDSIKRVIPKFATFICEPFDLHTIHISNSRSFEKERSTYCNDPSTMSHHKEKFAKFVETDLGLSDEDICLKGRCLLHTNSAIRTYYDQLVKTNEMNEATFWKRYFYAKYQAKLREILISKHTSSNEKVIESESDEDDEIELGDSDKKSDEIKDNEKQDIEDENENDEEEVELGDKINIEEKQDIDEKVIAENAITAKQSEETSSWTEVSKGSTKEITEESMTTIVIDKSEETIEDVTNAEENVDNKENNESDKMNETHIKQENNDKSIDNQTKNVVENKVNDKDKTNDEENKTNNEDGKAKTEETETESNNQESDEIDSDNLSLSGVEDIELDENGDDDGSDWGDWD